MRQKAWWRRKDWRAIALLVLCVIAAAHYGKKLDAAYPVEDWAFWPIALMWLYNIAFFAASLSAGVRVLTWLRVPGSALEKFAFAFPTGVLVFVLAMYGLGAARLFELPATLALALVLFASGAAPTMNFVRRVFSAWTLPEVGPHAISVRLIRVAALAYGVVCLALLYLPVLTQETLNFDAQWCHLTVAQDYAREGHIVRYDGDYARNHPQLAPFIHTWFWLLPVPTLLQRWTLPLHTEFMMVVCTLPGIAALVRYLLCQRHARMSWVGFFLFPLIFVYDNNLGGSSDHFMALFSPPLALAVGRAATTFDRRYLLLTGVMGAGALMTKYQASYLLPTCALVILAGFVIRTGRRILAARRDGKQDAQASLAAARRDALGMLLAAGAFALVVSPHFMRNWVFYDNPVYPFLQHVFPSNPTQPDAQYYFLNVFQDPVWRPRGTLAQRVSSSIELLHTFSLVPLYYFYRPDWPNFGALFTYTTPFLLLVRRPGRISVAVLLSLGAVFSWAMTFRNERNLTAFVPIMAAATVALLVRAWQLGWFARAGVVLLVGLQVIWGGDAFFYSQYGRLTSVINSFRMGYEKTTAQRFKSHPLVRAGKTLPPDAKVLYHNNRPTLGLDRVAVLDLTGSHALFSYANVQNVSELVREWRKGGVTHVLYDVHPGMARESRKLEILFQQFLRAVGPGKRFDNYGLIDIRNLSDLPNDVGQRVVMIGVPWYYDGVHPLTALSTIEYLPADLRAPVTPEAPIPTDAAALGRLFDTAAAALITGSPPARNVAREKGWSSVLSYRGYFSVYLPPTRSSASGR